MSVGSCEEQIYSILVEHREGLTIEDVSRILQINRTTAARYLESLYHSGKAERRPLGPAKLYKASFKIQSSDLLAILHEGIMISDSDGLIREINPSFCSLFSLNSNELKGRKISYSPISGLLSDDIIDALEHPPEIPSEGVLRILTNGSDRFFQYRIISLQLSEGTSGAAFIVSDQTDLYSSKVQNQDLETEFQTKLSLLHSNFSSNLEKAKTTVREVSSRERAIRDLIQNVQVIILKINASGRVVFCNHYASECANLSDGEQERPFDLSTLFPTYDERGVHIADQIRVVKEGEIIASQWESPLIIQNKNSSNIYSWNLIRLKKGNKGANMILAGFDITDLIARERTVIHTQKRLGWILDHLPDPTFAIDNNRTVILWNKQMESMTGLESGEAIGSPIDNCISHIYGYNRPVLADLIFNRYDPEITAFFKDLEQEDGALTAETIAYRQDGTKRIYWVKVTPYYGDDGEIVGAIQSIRDVTSYREDEEKIRNDEELLRGIAENTLDNIIVINREGTILYANLSLGRFIGISPEKIIGSHISMVQELKMIFPDCDRFKRAFITGVPIHDLFSIRHEGIDLLMDTTFIPEKDRSGLISSVLIVMRNITSLREELAQIISLG